MSDEDIFEQLVKVKGKCETTESSSSYVEDPKPNDVKPKDKSNAEKEDHFVKPDEMINMDAEDQDKEEKAEVGEERIDKRG